MTISRLTVLWNFRHAIARSTSSGCLDRLDVFMVLLMDTRTSIERLTRTMPAFCGKLNRWIAKLSSLRPPVGQIGRAICRGRVVSRQMQEDDQLHRKTGNSGRGKANFYSGASIRSVYRTLPTVTRTFLLAERRREQWSANYVVPRRRSDR